MKTKEDIDEKIIKQIIGGIFIVISFVLFLLSNVRFYIDFNFHRFLLCIAFSIFGLGLRACFYVQALKEKSELVNKKKVIISYSIYAIMLTIITCIMYLGFYQSISDLTQWHFICLSGLLFTFMGLVVATVIEKFGF